MQMCRAGRMLAVAVMVAMLPLTALQAQDGPLRSPVLTISQDRLFSGTKYGQAVQGRIDDQMHALQAENRKIETDLEDEEQALTIRRTTLAPEDFRVLADAFDAKVEGIRAAQDAKARTVSDLREQEQKRFFETAVPILAELMAEMGAVAILDKSAIVLSFERIDITDAAIKRIDTVLGADPLGDDAPSPGVTPDPPPSLVKP